MAQKRVKDMLTRSMIENGAQPDGQVTLIQAIAYNRDKIAFRQLFMHFAPRLYSFLLGGGTDPH